MAEERATPTESERAKNLSARARCIAVRVGEALYGLPVEFVQEVIGLRAVTRVFHAPPALAGVTNLRGDVLPVLDLGVLLGGEPAALTAEARIVVVREGGGLKRRAGLRVDQLSGLRDLPETLTPPPATTGELVREAARGLIAEPPPCVVLNVPVLLDSPLLRELGGALGPEGG